MTRQQHQVVNMARVIVLLLPLLPNRRLVIMTTTRNVPVREAAKRRDTMNRRTLRHVRPAKKKPPTSAPRTECHGSIFICIFPFSQAGKVISIYQPTVSVRVIVVKSMVGTGSNRVSGLHNNDVCCLFTCRETRRHRVHAAANRDKLGFACIPGQPVFKCIF
jgi:hypothetical protein